MVTAMSPLAIFPIFFLSPAALYIARSVPLTYIGSGFAELTIISDLTFVISLRTILNGIETPHSFFIPLFITLLR